MKTDEEQSIAEEALDALQRLRSSSDSKRVADEIIALASKMGDTKTGWSPARHDAWITTCHLRDGLRGKNQNVNLSALWTGLAAGDSHVKQDLLGHLREREKSLVIEGARVQLPMMLTHLRSAQGDNTHRLAQVLQIGKHELDVSLEKSFSGVALVDPPTRAFSRPSSSSGDSRWIWWVIGIVIFLFFVFVLRK